MVIRTEKNRIKALIIDTITLLCKNGLTSKMGFSLDGVIGVTSLDDEDDVFLIPIKEMIKHEFEKSTSESDLETHSSMSLQNKRKRKRRRSKVNSDNDGYEDIFTSLPDTVKQEEASDSDTDLVMVKEEPAKTMHLQATQLPLNESSLINDAVSMAALSPIQTYHAASGWSPQMPQHFGSHQAPPQLPDFSGDDIHAEVELVPGSGVYVQRQTLIQCQLLNKGSKVVRRLVKDLFPDIHVLANSSCVGKRDGNTGTGLDPRKVEAIKDYTLLLFIDMTRSSVVQHITYACMDARKALRRKHAAKLASMMSVNPPESKAQLVSMLSMNPPKAAQVAGMMSMNPPESEAQLASMMSNPPE